MTAGMAHVTNGVTPGSGGNRSREYDRRHQLMTAGAVHVTNLTPPGVTTLPMDMLYTLPGKSTVATQRRSAGSRASQHLSLLSHPPLGLFTRHFRAGVIN